MKYLFLALIFSTSIFAKEELSKTTYFGALDLGMGTQKSDDTIESNKQNGTYLGAKGYLSYDLPHLKMDLGLGYFNYKIKTDLTSGAYSSVSLETKAPYIHLSPKYKFSESFFLGVELNYVLDKGIMLSPNTNSEIMTGLNATYQFNVKNQVDMRLVASASRTMDLSDKDLMLGMLSIQIGFTPKADVQPVKLQPNQQLLVNGIVHTKRQITQVTLDETMIHFETNSFDLSLKSQALLSELSAYLASHPDLWQALEIEGHTDYRGGEEFNTILSIKRANAVFSVMSQVSMPKDRVIFLGKGKSTPLDTGVSDDSLAKNRRVELKFINVSDKDSLLNFIAQLKTKYSVK